MDAENDNDQPNSSSASASSSSSNNSSSSNLLGHLPMLPFMRSTDDDEPVADHLADGNDHHHNNDVINNDLNEEPMPLQPPPPPPVTQAMAMATAAQPASASVLQATMAPITTTATAATGAGTSTASSTSSVGREEPMVGAEQLAVLSSSSSASSLPLPLPPPPPPLSSASTSSSSSTSTSYFATTSSSHTTTRLPPSAFLPSANPSQVIFSPFLFDMPAAISASTHAHDFNKSLSPSSSLPLPSPFSPTISSQTFTHLMSPMSDSNTPPLLTSSSPSSSAASSSSPSSTSSVHPIHYNLAQSQLSLFHEQDPIPTTSFSISSQQQQQLSPHQASSPTPQPPPPPTPPQPTSASTIIESTTVVQSSSPASSLLLQHTEHAAPGQSQQQGQVVEQQQLTAQIINRNDIADTIDASAVIVQPLETNAEEIGHQPHIYPQEAASEAEVEQQQQQQQNNIQLDDNDNNDFDVDLNIRNDEAVAVVASSSSSASVAAAVAQQQQHQRTQSLTLDTSASGSAGPSSSTLALEQQQQQQQTPQLPTTLPLLLQQQQQQQPPPLLQQQQQQSEESKHLPSFDHHYHNPREFHLHAHPYQHPCVYPYGFRSNSPSSHNNNNNTNGAHINSGSSLNTNNIMFGSSMSSDHRNHHGSSTSGLGGVVNTNSSPQVVDRLKMLYPNVNENETPLPRCWSPHDKCLSIGLSQNNLRVHFKGVGKQSNDAASVRTAHPIPPACGIYYFEVEIISKGKNGYMGIGLTAQQFRMNRLPGWDKQSYGYHGDDGNSFSSSGHGQSYGPTFTTGDVIGCCVNFVNNTCFYTKNGIDLGIAFRDLPNKLYPTVGLQTPGEEVDANFGQEPFKFDQIEDMMKQMRAEMTATIYDFPLPAEQGDPTTLLQKLVSSYLVHNGYSQTAEAFSRQKTGQNLREDVSSIRNRQRILKLVMAGKIGQAIEQTLRSYPGLLENNKNLWFMLKIRQFIEMINGSDIEYCPTSSPSTTTTTTTNKTPCTHSITTQTSSTSLAMSSVPQQTSVIQSTKSYQNGNGGGGGGGPSTSSNGSLLATNLEDHPSTSGSTIAVTKTTTTTASTNNTTNLNNNNNSNNNTTANNLTIATVANSPAAAAATAVSLSSSSSVATNTVAAATTITTTPAAATATTIINAQNSSHMTVIHTDNDLKTQSNLVEHCSATNDAPSTIGKSNNDNDYLNDVEMENNGQHNTTNGNVCKNGNTNNFNDSMDADEEMEVDVSPAVKNFSHGIERILEFGKELSKMGTQLDKEKKMSDDEKRMMENAFSLIAYSNPWASPLGWQLCPSKREPVCRALNSAILESMNYPKMPPLEYCVAHANELLKVMAQASLGACAFVNIADVFPKN